jgi:hypothetical protein
VRLAGHDPIGLVSRRHRFSELRQTKICSTSFATASHSPSAMTALCLRFNFQTISAKSKCRISTSLSFVKGLTSRLLHKNPTMSSPLKRKLHAQVSHSNSKKPKIGLLEYHTTPSRYDETGEIIWPARRQQIDRAREIINEWY